MRLLPAALLLLLPVVTPAQDKPDPAVAEFQKRLADKSADPEKLRMEILEMVRNRAGTPAAVQAAGLLTKIPSPLDKLDKAQIPELDRFPWQPKELVAVAGEHRARQGSLVTCLAWTRDGKRVVSGGSNSYLRVWDAATMRQEMRAGTHYYTTCLAVSRDGKTLAAGTIYGYLHVFDLTGKEPKQTDAFPVGTSTVHDVDISADGKLIAAGSHDGLVHTFDLDGSKAKKKTELSGHKANARAVRFTPDSKILAAAAGDGTVRFWSFAGGDKINELGSLDLHKGACSAMAVPPRGGALAIATDDGHIYRVTLGAKFTKGAFFKTPTAITSIGYSSLGTLTTSHSDGIVRTWGTGTATKPTLEIAGHVGIVSSFAWSPDGKTLATGGHDWTVRQWTFAGRPTEKFPLKGHHAVVPQIAFAPDGASIACASYDNTARVWALSKAAPSQYATFNKDNTPLYAVAFSPDGKSLASAGQNVVARLWDLSKRNEIRSFPMHPTYVHQLAFLQDGQRLLASSGKTVVMWNAQRATEMFRFDSHENRVNSISVSPDGGSLLTGTGYYKYDKGKIVTIKGEYQYDDCALRFFDLKTGKLKKDALNLEKPVQNVTYMPDGKRFACSLWGNPAHLWEASADGLAKKGVVKTSSLWSHHIAFSPDGRLMATIGNDYKLRLVELATDKALKEWTFDETISHFAISPDSRYLAVSIQTGPVYVLRLDEGK